MRERAAVVHFGASRASVKKFLGFPVPPSCRRTAEIKRPKLDGVTDFIDQSMSEDLSRNHKQCEVVRPILTAC
jgi:hypothetical protein